MALRPYSSSPFVNQWGHLINVGDSVVAVAQGYGHAIKVYTGTFVGYRDRTPIVKVNQKTYNRSTGKYEMRERITNLPSGRVFPTSAPLLTKG